MPSLYEPVTLAALIAIGMLAGTLGGLLGVGGSVIIIPGLAIIFGRGENQHLYQAAAMTVNVAVALPAAMRHRQAGAMIKPVLKWMLPAAIVFVIVGVLLSNLPIFRDNTGGIWLGRLLAVFLVYVVYLNIRRLIQTRANTVDPRPTTADLNAPNSKVSPPRSITVGGIMGVTAGLLGVGGGALAVPLQQTILNLPLRNCIANSSAVIIFSAAVGATLKLLTLGQHGIAPASALILALILTPSAIIGARLGAGLTHSLPNRMVRFIFALLMIAATLKMASIPGLPI